MVTFNFSGVSGSKTAQKFKFFDTTIYTSTVGTVPVTFTSVQTGVGLPGGTMSFVLSPVSGYYGIYVSDYSDQIYIESTRADLVLVTVTLAFSDGGGNNMLSNASASFASNTIYSGEAFWITAGGVTTAGIESGVQFAGTVFGIQFVTTDILIMTSLSGTLACFARGTEIATPEGARAVQDLAIGDVIATAEGDTRAIKWIGRQSFDTKFGVPAERRPVRIAAGALGGGLPVRDLILTADHALLIDGLLINAGALVNGTTITYDTASEMARRFTVFHIETEDHAVILAEGAPAETFIDYAGRRQFDNFAEYAALYGDDQTIREANYPRVSAVRQRVKAA